MIANRTNRTLTNPGETKMNQALATETKTGIIPGNEYAAGDNPKKMLAQRVLAGNLDPFSEAEVAELVEQRYFSFAPINPITEAEADLLRKEMIERLLHSLNRYTSREFLVTECYLLPDSTVKEGYQLCSVGPRFKAPKSLTPLTIEEKIAFLDDPKNIGIYWAKGNGSSNLALMGYREISGYSQFGSRENFTATVRKIQQDTGKNNLHILDFGGGNGRALHEVKIMHPELVTYNATRDEEQSSYAVDFQVVCFLERMPAELRGKIDFIFSNMATRYLAFCDLAVQGGVEALAPGGVMDVFFSGERSCNHDERDVKRRMKRAYEYLKDLEASRVIQLNIDGSFSSNVGGSFLAEENSLYPASNVQVVKL